jgi:hypothetical protein
MPVSERIYGKLSDGQEVKAYVMSNAGVQVELLTYGAVSLSLFLSFSLSGPSLFSLLFRFDVRGRCEHVLKRKQKDKQRETEILLISFVRHFHRFPFCGVTL